MNMMNKLPKPPKQILSKKAHNFRTYGGWDVNKKKQRQITFWIDIAELLILIAIFCFLLNWENF